MLKLVFVNKNFYCFVHFCVIKQSIEKETLKSSDALKKTFDTLQEKIKEVNKIFYGNVNL